MRKRCIIAGIFTLCILCLTNSFWLEIKHKNTLNTVKPPQTVTHRGVEHKPNHSNRKRQNHVKFEFEIFVIVLVLSYLLSYKLIDYLADFKTIKDKSRIEILFLAIFFTLLFIPMMYISDAKTSKSENRTLAKWKPLIAGKGRINYNFGKDFDNWYNDRFFPRSLILKGYNQLKYYIALNYFENTKGFINKRNHWLSSDFGHGKWIVSQKEKDLTIRNIQKLTDFCNKNGIKPYIIIVPRKEEICIKELYPRLKKVSNYKQTNEIIEYIKEKTGIEIIYPYKELEELQRVDTAYFKTDHHWTDEGAYIAYLQVMNQVKKDFPEIKISQPDDFNYKYTQKIKVAPYANFHNGITYRSMNLHDKKLLDRKYKYFYHKTFDCMKYEYENHSKEQYHIFLYHNSVNAPNAVLMGDSFSLNLLPTLPTSFKDTTNVYSYVLENNITRAFNIKRFEKYILANNPKVLIITLCDIKRLQYLFKESE